MNARFVIVLAHLVALSIVAVVVVVPISSTAPYHIQNPKSVAGCFAVSVGDWETHHLRDSLAIVVPETVALSLDPNNETTIGSYPYRVYPAGLPGQAAEQRSASDWGVHYHGGINAHWSYRFFGLSLYLNPARGALRGWASLAVHDASWNWRHERAEVVLTRTTCPAGLLPDKGWSPPEHQTAGLMGGAQ